MDFTFLLILLLLVVRASFGDYDWAAWTGFLAALAGLVATVTALVMSLLGYRLSAQTHDLQKTADTERQALMREAEARNKEQVRLQRARQDQALDEMTKQEIADTQRNRDPDVDGLARFTVSGVDGLGQRWQLSNSGKRDAGEIEVRDVTIGNQGSLDVASNGPNIPVFMGVSLEAGKTGVEFDYRWGYEQRAALLEIRWQETYEVPLSEEELAENEINEDGIPMIGANPGWGYAQGRQLLLIHQPSHSD